jgi:hypothetical protein
MFSTTYVHQEARGDRLDIMHTIICLAEKKTLLSYYDASRFVLRRPGVPSAQDKPSDE